MSHSISQPPEPLTPFMSAISRQPFVVDVAVYRNLLSCIRNCNLPAIKNILEQHIYHSYNIPLMLNTILPGEDSPLLCACRRDNLSVVRYLLFSGADPNLQNSSHESPLFIACRQGYYEIAETLFEFGAMLPEPTSGKIPVSYFFNDRIVQLLVDMGLSLQIDLPSDMEEVMVSYLEIWNEIIYPASSLRFRHMPSGNIRGLSLLLNAGAEITISRHYNKYYEQTTGIPETVNTKKSTAATAKHDVAHLQDLLYYACRYGLVNIVALCLARDNGQRQRCVDSSSGSIATTFGATSTTTTTIPTTIPTTTTTSSTTSTSTSTSTKTNNIDNGIQEDLTNDSIDNNNNANTNCDAGTFTESVRTNTLDTVQQDYNIFTPFLFITYHPTVFLLLLGYAPAYDILYVMARYFGETIPPPNNSYHNQTDANGDYNAEEDSNNASMMSCLDYKARHLRTRPLKGDGVDATVWTDTLLFSILQQLRPATLLMNIANIVDEKGNTVLHHLLAKRPLLTTSVTHHLTNHNSDNEDTLTNNTHNNMGTIRHHHNNVRYIQSRKKQRYFLVSLNLLLQHWQVSPKRVNNQGESVIDLMLSAPGAHPASYFEHPRYFASTFLINDNTNNNTTNNSNTTDTASDNNTGTVHKFQKSITQHCQQFLQSMDMPANIVASPVFAFLFDTSTTTTTSNESQNMTKFHSSQWCSAQWPQTLFLQSPEPGFFSTAGDYPLQVSSEGITIYVTAADSTTNRDNHTSHVNNSTTVRYETSNLVRSMVFEDIVTPPLSHLLLEQLVFHLLYHAMYGDHGKAGSNSTENANEIANGNGNSSKSVSAIVAEKSRAMWMHWRRQWWLWTGNKV